MTLTLDHLLYAGPDLERSTVQLRRLSGETPAVGGRHVGFGTHNALLGLGQDTYLEAIAPDPEQEGGAFASSIGGLSTPELHAWCVRTGDPDALVAAIEASGHGVDRHAMSRTTSDGDELSWELLFATDHPWAGAAPFFIHWGDTPHPATRLQGEVRCRQLAVQQNDPAPLAAWLDAIGLANGAGEAVNVEAAPARGLRADLTGRRGPFVLRGGGGGIRL